MPLRGALVAGMLVTAGGTLLLYPAIAPGASWLAMLPGLVVVGAGVGLVNPLATFAHLGVLPPAQGGLASALNNTARQLGLAVGIAVLGALLEASMPDGAAGGAARAAGFADAVQELLLIALAANVAGALAAALLVHHSDLWSPPRAAAAVSAASSGGPRPPATAR